MKVSQLMTKQVISVAPDESAEIAARTLHRYNIGILPVCGADGSLYGLLTDRDLVTRCMASGKLPKQTKVREIMSSRITAISPDAMVAAAAEIMGQQQVRRLPVVEQGRLLGILSLGDLAKHREIAGKTEETLAEISQNPLRKKA